MSAVRIAVASDERYLPGAIGTLAGLRIALATDVPMEVAFLHDGLPCQKQQRLLTALAKICGDTSVHFIRIDGGFTGFPEFYFSSKLTYARLLLPSLLDWERLIYIDTDFLVLRSLEPLYRRETGEYGISAAAEYSIQKIAGDFPEAALADQVDANADYFNAGLLVLNLEKIRQNRLFDRATRILSEYPSACKLHDQSALNYAANGRFIHLEQEWNIQNHRACFDPVGAIDLLANRSINTHFVTDAKPWLSWCPYPANEMFRLLLDKVDSEWRTASYREREVLIRHKYSMASFLPIFFLARAFLKKSMGIDGGSDLRTAGFWRTAAADMRRMRRQAANLDSLFREWSREIDAKLV